MATYPNENAVDTNMEENIMTILAEGRKKPVLIPSLPSQPRRIRWADHGWFLINCNADKYSPPLVPQNYKNPSQITIKEPKVDYKGWSNSLHHWGEWVEKLKPKYGSTWRLTGIYNAIVASTYRIKRDPSSIVGLASYWCDETNTFLFPWGEVTITLEDVILLGGIPALGKSVRDPLPNDMTDMNSRLIDERLRFNRTASKRATHPLWLKEFMERDQDDDNLEHAAFLSCWLSLFVFPSHPATTLKQYVFPIAVRLSQGKKIALAPSVLANIYRDLTGLKNYLVNGGNKGASLGASEDGSLVLWAPLQILQMWAWERFPGLRPRTFNSFRVDRPRAAMWHEAGIKLDQEYVHEVLNRPNGFNFRAYMVGQLDWYKIGESQAESKYLFHQFARCLNVSELVGMDCIEQYLPNRVAWQLGFDQDVPSPLQRAKHLGWQFAWRTYELEAPIMLFVPPDHQFEQRVTLDYLNWYHREMRVSYQGSSSANGEIIEID
ncbi:hypothetical protein LUZ60_005514 [Juncus effusus]|nr:hypothetical protein LUZ60_005514 [Juncus effusus]